MHIPFCVSKCIYCDFLSFPTDDDTKKKYVDALCREIESFASRQNQEKQEKIVIPTIFLGGGTPSVLPAEYIVRILDTIRKYFYIAQEAEITVECNPGTLTAEKLTAYKNAGVNRLSIGLQSPDDKELKSLGRIHTYAQFLESYEAAHAAGFNNINIDLMSAIPYQTIEGYENNLRKIIALEPTHISAYSLIVEEGTPLYNMVEKSGGKILPTEDEDRQMYALTKKILHEAGYERYEISNYAKAGFECRHNSSYWTRVDYAGFGIGAASLVKGVRYTNTSDMNSYLMNPVENYAEKNILTRQDEMEEFMFLGLRMTKGISIDDFERYFDVPYEEIYGEITKKQINKGLMEKVGNRYRLTDLGLDVSNSVMAEFLFD